ncbi:MAG: GldG family protein [Candidatus Berkiella sp.]
MKTTTHFAKEILRALMILIICLALIFLAKKYSFGSHFSSTQRLSMTSESLLKKIEPDVTLTLFSTNIEDYHQAAFLISQYQAIKPNMTLYWQQQPYAHSSDYHGPALEITIEKQKDIIDLLRNTLNESTLTQCMFKLRNNAEQWVVFLQGHNEPSPFGTKVTDYDLLRIALQNQGLKIQTLSLTNMPVIADNTRLLIIASPKTNLLPKEEQLIAQYLFQGGSLLWLVDNESHPQPFLSEMFHVKPLPGTIVDLHGHQLGTPHPAITIIDTYPSLPFSAPKTLTAFPFAVALHLEANHDWQTEPLLLTHDKSWTESGPLSGAIAFEPENNEVPGPLMLGLSLTKKSNLPSQANQRIAIIGNSRFLSNGMIENYGNLAFGLNLIHWLGHDDQLLSLEQPTNQDELLNIHLFTALFIQYGFPSMILLFACLGAFAYRKRIRLSQN